MKFHKCAKMSTATRKGAMPLLWTPILSLAFFAVALYLWSNEIGAAAPEAGMASAALAGTAAGVHHHVPSYEQSLDAVRRVAQRLQAGVVPACRIREFGSGWGQHALCDLPPPKPCHFYSFGISKDYSFDADLADTWGCQGVAADPTIVHPSTIHPRVTFHNVAAKMRGQSDFAIVTSLPAFRHWLNHSHVTVLKMDCEGCEYSLGEDVAREDPTFFDRIDQFAVEVHVSRAWLNDRAALHSMGMLYHFLEKAGLELQHAAVGGCGPDKEAMGCMDELVAMDYPCGTRKSCHNYLFSRTDLTK